MMKWQHLSKTDFVSVIPDQFEPFFSENKEMLKFNYKE